MVKQVVTHHRLLQVSGVLSDKKVSDPFESAVSEIFQWLENKVGNAFPPEGHKGDMTFSTSIGGHRIEAVDIDFNDGKAKLWALDYSHPDEDGNIWNTQFVLAQQNQGKPLIGLKLGAKSSDSDANLALSIPKAFRNICSTVGVEVDGQEATGKAMRVCSRLDDQDSFPDFIRLLEDPSRKIPLIVISTPQDLRDMQGLSKEADRIAEMNQGIAHVCLLEGKASWDLTNAVGRELSVFKGAIRIYQPDFKADSSNKFHHPIYQHEKIGEWNGGVAGFRRHLQSKMFQQSVLSIGADEDIPSFSDLKKIKLNQALAALQQKQTQQQQLSPVTQDSDRLARLFEENALLLNETQLLNQKLELARQDASQSLSLAVQEEQRADAAERRVLVLEGQNAELSTQMEQFKQQYSKVRNNFRSIALYPDNLKVIEDWGDQYLGDRVLLHPRAISGAKKSNYRHPELVYRGLQLLANEYWDMKTGAFGKDTSMLKQLFDLKCTALHLEDAFSISKIGAGNHRDQYYVNSGKERLFLERHLGNGTSRDPSKTLRIYYAWDDKNERVVVGHMPDHLDNGMT